MYENMRSSKHKLYTYDPWCFNLVHEDAQASAKTVILV